jgi:hypothetical protein
MSIHLDAKGTKTRVGSILSKLERRIFLGHIISKLERRIFLGHIISKLERRIFLGIKIYYPSIHASL